MTDVPPDFCLRLQHLRLDAKSEALKTTLIRSTYVGACAGFNFNKFWYCKT